MKTCKNCLIEVTICKKIEGIELFYLFASKFDTRLSIICKELFNKGAMMDAIKKYWKNPLFLIGMFLCAVGTITAIAGAHHAGVWVELAGFTVSMVAIYLINIDSDEKIH